jgi:asparagine synthase (glutamine-hydrolysing)
VYPGWLEPDFARRLNLQDRSREWSELPAERPHPILPKAHASLALPHWSSMFELENAGVTRCAVEVRHPFLDLRIVNFMLALPPFPLFFQKQLLREAVAGRLPESVRMRRKAPLAGSPLVEHLRKSPMAWTEHLDWDAEMDGYVDKSALAAFHNETHAEKAHSALRPLCLNFWLQSARKVRYNLRAEVRNA